MDPVDVKMVSCATCWSIAFLGADSKDELYLLCLVCQRATPIPYIQERIKAGENLKRIKPRDN